MSKSVQPFLVNTRESLAEERFRGSLISTISRIPRYEEETKRPLVSGVQEHLMRQSTLLGLDFNHIVEQARSTLKIRQTFNSQTKTGLRERHADAEQIVD